jgi:hypothetical protein
MKDNHQWKGGKADPVFDEGRQQLTAREGECRSTTGVREQGMHERVARELGRASHLLGGKPERGPPVKRDLALGGGFLAAQRAERDGTHKSRRE